MYCNLIFTFLCYNISESFEHTDITKIVGGTDCYSTDESIGAMKIYEIKIPKGKCMKAECHGGGLITVQKCNKKPSNLERSVCRFEEQTLEPYPYCCGKLICEN